MENHQTQSKSADAEQPSPEGLSSSALFDVGLTDAERELLALLMEECGEVVQVIGKILRHGYDSRNPLEPESPTNRELLERELGDVGAAQLMLEESGDLIWTEIRMHAKRKLESVRKWLHFNPSSNI